MLVGLRRASLVDYCQSCPGSGYRARRTLEALNRQAHLSRFVAWDLYLGSCEAALQEDIACRRLSKAGVNCTPS